MLVVVLAIVGAIYYAVMTTELLPALRSARNEARWAAAACGVVMYTADVGMLLWCYLACFWMQPGHVPPGWHPFIDEEQGSRIYMERSRFCNKCQAWKPPRAHHDSMTGRCVLKLDHYCVWVLNCVGLLNYKAFVLFLCYACLGCIASAALLVRPCMRFFRTRDPPLADLLLAFVAEVFSTAFSLALLGFVIMHLRLIALNQTTIEAYEKRPIKPWPYDRGWRHNCLEVFGRKQPFVPLAPLNGSSCEEDEHDP
eukprot:scaffold8.g1586.t1